MQATTAILVTTGAGLMLSAIIAGIRLNSKLPHVMQDNWQMLITLMAMFFCGQLLFAVLLILQFPYPNLLTAFSILLGGGFSLLVIGLARSAVQNIAVKKEALSKIAKEAKLKEVKLFFAQDARHKAELKLQQSDAFFVKELFELMNEVLANRDQYTFEHALRVAAISKAIGRELGLEPEDLESLELGCLVHDIGKTAIPDDILLKPERFDSQDKHIMSFHPLIGAKLVARHIKDDRIVDIILNHHERITGKGYPAGKKGKEISIFARIVAVADTYEALVAHRPYKKLLSREEALAILQLEAQAGQLDQEIVNTLMVVIATMPPFDEIPKVTAGFMQDVELFRNRAYFREPLSDFYNYRYLLFLDDAGVLEKDARSYYLVLIAFPSFGFFQESTGHIVADQVLDEIGQNLVDACYRHSHQRQRYDSSMIVLRKNIDYLLYLECEGDDACTELIEEVNRDLADHKRDWGIDYTVHQLHCPAGLPIIQGIRRICGDRTYARTAAQNSPSSARYSHT